MTSPEQRALARSALAVFLGAAALFIVGALVGRLARWSGAVAAATVISASLLLWWLTRRRG